MAFNIQLTSSAHDYIKNMLAKEKSKGFRLSIKKTGCSGYSYAPSLVDDVNQHDMTIQVEGISFFIDSAWQSMFKEIQIDYIEETKSGLKQKRLVFTNPKEASRCGCGESFHVEQGDV